MVKPTILTLTVLGPFILLLGCGSMPVTRTQSVHKEIDGLSITVHPLLHKSEVDEIFKINLLDRGILPINIRAENHSPSASFMLPKERVQVMVGTSQASTSSDQIARDLAGATRAGQLGLAASTLSPIFFSPRQPVP